MCRPLINEQIEGKKRVALCNDHGHVVGEDHPRAKLKNDEVWLIADMRDGGASYAEIAEVFGVSKSTVASICRYERRAQTATTQRVIRVKRKKRTPVLECA